MKPKTIKIIYWVVTILFSLAIFFGAVGELMQNEQSVEVLKHLGYPIYFNIILGVAKVIGVVAILQWKFKTLKEWAYAGFSIDIISASASMYFNGDGIVMTVIPLVFLTVMFVSYFLWKKMEAQKSG